jgi:hypothetical protein
MGEIPMKESYKWLYACACMTKLKKEISYLPMPRFLERKLKRNYKIN